MSGSRVRPRARHRLLVEPLEGRTLPSFFPAVFYPVGSAPRAAEVADFNGDTLPDLAVPNILSDTVSLLLGTGQGAFADAGTLASAREPHFAAARDFDGDGAADLLVSASAEDVYALYRGNGDGSFRDAEHHPADDAWPHRQAAADFNGDGHWDVAVVHTFGNTLRVLLGNGDGTFAVGEPYPIPADPVGVVAADLDGDGALDLAVSSFSFAAGGGGNVSVWLGNGDGSFRAHGGFATGEDSWSVAAADFDRDGVPDLAFTESGRGVGVARGAGDGTFLPADYFALDGVVTDVAAADVNGDGVPDLVAAANSLSAAAVLLGRGDGTFGPPEFYAVDPGPFFVAAADLDGDGRADLVVAHLGGDEPGTTVAVLLNDGDWGGSPGVGSPARPRVDGVLEALAPGQAAQGLGQLGQREARADERVQVQGTRQEEFAGAGHVARREVEAAEHADFLVVLAETVHRKDRAARQAAEEERLPAGGGAVERLAPPLQPAGAFDHTVEALRRG